MYILCAQQMLVSSSFVLFQPVIKEQHSEEGKGGSRELFIAPRFTH